MADVFTTAKIEIKHDEVLDMYNLIVRLPKPNGPLVFGATKEQLQALQKQLNKVLAD